MRRRFTLLAAILTLCVSAAQAQSADENRAASFSISSLKSPFAFAGTFEGEYQIRPESIEVTISRASIQLRDNCPYRGRRQLAFINVSLASSSPSGKWKVIGHARAIPVGETMQPGDEYLADRLRFSIPKDSSLDLSSCWLVIEMGEISLDSNDEDRVGYAFAQSDHDIFTPRVVKAAK